MAKPIRHLYIHIPFCKNICAYCDFVRQVKEDNLSFAYIQRVIKEIDAIPNKLETIYIGGGTPNCLNDEQLTTLLKHACAKLLKTNYEFTVELNPELVNKTQCDILKSHKVNRASIGLQTTNDRLLRKFNRHHCLNDVQWAIDNLKKVGITNINLDLMYGFNEMNTSDITRAVKFIKKNNIKHVSWYALEVKDNSAIAKQKYQINDDHVEKQLRIIIKCMRSIYFQRYEVSSWSKNKTYESRHNKAYWLSKDWMTIGLGGAGFENKIYYKNVGNTSKWHKQIEKYSIDDYYFHILSMGLRLKNGLDLKEDLYRKVYKHFKNKLKFTHIKDHHLISNNLNLLNETLMELL